MKKVLYLLLTVFMLAGIVSVTVFGTNSQTNIDLTTASFVIEEAGEYVINAYTGANTLTIKADATVTLNGVNITADTDKSAISIESGNVTLVVADNSTLIGGDNGAGVYVAEGASVTITGSGKLTAMSNAGVDDASGAAAIGGTWTTGNSGAITIDGATVEAIGYGVHGSGIGSGSGKVVGKISIINGANVTAYGGYYADGEGTKLQSDYGKTDPEGGVGIGGGAKTVSTIADIVITDSTVNAYGGSKAAGIGVNFWSACGTITISGNSNVFAQGGSSSAGIGTSRVSNYNNHVTANIIIKGGQVTAIGGDYGAGIGTGYNNNSKGNGASASELLETDITISGGTVKATGGLGGAGIGGGYKSDNVDVDITGGTVVAIAGELVGKAANEGGSASAIGTGANGSGKFENCPNVEISNAVIDVTSYYGGKPAIHGYVNSTLDSDYKLTEIGKPIPIVEMDGVEYPSIKDALWTLKSADTTVHTVKVLKDHEIDVNYSTYNYPILVNGFSIILDLNGKTITADWSKYTGTRADNALIGVCNGGKLDVIDSVGDGKIVNNDNNPDVENRIFWIMTSTKDKSIIVNIKGGTFVQNESNTALLYVQGNKPSENLAPMYVTITGGHFETINDDFFNAYDGFQHTSLIYGGTFNKKPDDWEIKIAEGYKSSENEDGIWGVTKEVLLDFTNAIGDESGEGYIWDHENKILTLDNINYSTDTERIIGVPDGSTIKIIGENIVESTASTIQAIYIEGEAVIEGVGENASLTANGSIVTPDTVVDAGLELKNVDVNIGRNNISIRNDNGTRGDNGTAGTATFSMDNSSLYCGPVFVGAHLSSNHSYTRTSAVFSMTDSSIDIQGGGKSAMIFVWGDCGVDFDVVDSNVKIWNSGWQQNDINIQGGNDHYGVTGEDGVVLDVNIDRSNLDLYDYWSGLSVSRYYGNSADINFNMNESTVSTMTKYGSAGITIAESTETGTTTKAITNSITFLTNDPGHTGTQMKVNAEIIGNPVVHKDYTIVMQTGGTNDFSGVDFDLTLAEGQTVSIEEGVIFTSEKPISMSVGSYIRGNYVGEIIAPEGCIEVRSGEGDSLVITVYPEEDVHTITANVTPENSGVVTGAGTYITGDEVTLTASANTGYKFVQWLESDDVVGTDPIITFTAESDRTLIAVFEEKTLEDISISPENITMERGETVQLNAVIDGVVSNTAVDWVISENAADSVISSEGLLTVGKNETAKVITVTAVALADNTKSASVVVTIIDADNKPDNNFDYNHWYRLIMLLYSKEFDITASATEGGTITPAGISKVKYDKNITYIITPDEGYAIADVLVDGKSVGAVAEYTIKRIKEDHTISAIFVKTAWENPYTDVSDEAWYYEDIEFVSENDLMIGTGDNKFSPSAIVNRAMLVTVLWRLEGSPVVDSPVDFYDVPADEWYTAAVNWAAANGIVNGYGDGIFGAMNDLTHEQIVAILNRYAVYKKWSENVSGNADDSYTNSEWAENNVLWADLYGMFDGIDSDISDLTEGADRAELAAYLRRFCERFMTE